MPYLSVAPRVAGALIAVFCCASPVMAQELCPCPPPEPPPPPPPVWSGSLGAGLAFTQGNSDTTNTNLSFDLKRDPQARTVLKAEGLYLRASQEGSRTVDRGLLSGRFEYKVSDRAYTFTQVQYLRDRFKEIEYLVAPTVGLGYKLLDSERTTFDVDAALGVVVEKVLLRGAETDGALTAGEKFTHKLSETATFTQGVTALWKMDDVGDALYTFGVGLAASVTTRIQIKTELQDIYRTRPSGVGVQRNDIAFLTALVYKF